MINTEFITLREMLILGLLFPIKKPLTVPFNKYSLNESLGLGKGLSSGNSCILCTPLTTSK